MTSIWRFALIGFATIWFGLQFPLISIKAYASGTVSEMVNGAESISILCPSCNAEGCSGRLDKVASLHRLMRQNRRSLREA